MKHVLGTWSRSTHKVLPPDVPQDGSSATCSQALVPLGHDHSEISGKCLVGTLVTDNQPSLQGLGLHTEF